MARWHALLRHLISLAGEGNILHVAATGKHDEVAGIAVDY